MCHIKNNSISPDTFEADKGRISRVKEEDSHFSICHGIGYIHIITMSGFSEQVGVMAMDCMNFHVSIRSIL